MRAPSLTDARLQLHHAAQLAASFGISFLPAKPDDSHTNLEWLGSLRALASNPVPAGATRLRVGIRVEDLTLLLTRDDAVVAARSCTGRTVVDAAAWLEEQLRHTELPAGRYTLKRHYEIPSHAVGAGASFDAGPDDLGELARWFANAAALFEALRASSTDAGEVRCWPHHFDLATLLTPHPGASVGVGLEPGDAYYDEPYFYVNASPPPRVEALPPSLAGGGSWHTREWIGAVLPGSRLAGDATEQQRRAAEFVASGVAACRALVADA